MRILVDCSHYFRGSEGRGIDRVVSKVLNYMPDFATADMVDLRAIAEFGDGIFREVPIPKGPTTPTAPVVPNRGTVILRAMAVSTGTVVKRLARIIIPFGIVLWLKKVNLKYRGYSQRRRYEPVNLTADDIIFCPDAGWNLSEKYMGAITLASKKGAKIVPLFYDLIPETHPHFVPAYLHRNFRSWLMGVLELSDHALAISNDVAKAVKKTSDHRVKVATTLLGADFSHFENTDVRPKLVNFFESQSPYIMVGTLETRKNQETALKAFQILWKEGLYLRLYMIGTVLSLSQHFYEQMSHLPQWGTLLQVIEDVTDEELSFCYVNARALIAASFAEGFDLPVVEALHYSTPVIASDIPVHHEIAHDHVTYFDPTSPEQLARIIRSFERNDPAMTRGNNFTWINWRDSVENMYKAVRSHIK